jgi:hypothetical protein
VDELSIEKNGREKGLGEGEGLQYVEPFNARAIFLKSVENLWILSCNGWIDFKAPKKIR